MIHLGIHGLARAAAIAAVGVVASLAHAATPAVSFRVTLDRAASDAPLSGRLVVFLLRQGARVGSRAEPADAPFYDDPQPMFAADVRDLAPGGAFVVDEASASGFPGALRDLKPGTYKVQAVLDTQRLDSDWSREPGNVYSRTVSVDVGEAAASVDLTLDQRVTADDPTGKGYELFETRSALLSAFHGRPVVLRAGVVPPRDMQAGRRYPAIYDVPGFGGNHESAQYKNMIHSRMGNFAMELGASAFTIVLDPESGNGHTLFADSANNGPVGRALVEELIPALEAKYPLIASPTARVVTGHSSGGWSSLWLAITYPDVFGACWSGAPDPVDFHALQKVNIYEHKNFFVGPDGTELASNVQDGKVLMTIRQENEWEEVRGPGNTSGGQWDSWQAVWGPRNEAGNPAALFDVKTGEIDPRVVEFMRAYDITNLVRTKPEVYAPLFAQRVRIIVGDQDEWNLHAAVLRLKEELARHGVAMDGVGSPGKITIVPGADHSTVTRSNAYRAIESEILAFFKAGLSAPKDDAAEK